MLSRLRRAGLPAQCRSDAAWTGTRDRTATSAIGALCRYVSNVETKNFQPVNITFGLLEPLPPELRKKYKRKRERHEVQVERALSDWDDWLAALRPGSVLSSDAAEQVKAHTGE